MINRGFYTLFYKETLRFYKVALQTILAPIITTLLYFLVFSHVLKDRVMVFEDLSYTSFLIPGLVMMTIIQNAFANSSSSLIQSKVTGNIIFVLLAPLSYVEFYMAFMLASVVRGLAVGVGVFLIAICFVPVPVHSYAFLFVFALLGSAVLGTLGIIAGIWAEKFDQLAGFQNFIIMPLSFLSGVFYSIHSLPVFWQVVSHLNPFFYMVDGFRYGFFGVSDTSPWISLVLVSLAFIGLANLAIKLLKQGYKLRH
ncbi:MAG: ABC transporter permease [Thiotrichaceae bacterium]|nr:ABC transporter permease [Thiotrichaceae bacterium]PCI15073.1 MAG: metal-dependent hydrolase [Thiotrichales bacterium]